MEWKCSESHNDQWMVEQVFKGVRNGFFIEAGAADGNAESATNILEKEFGWTGFLFEPTKIMYDRLIHERNAVCLNKALYDYDGYVTFLNSQNTYYSGVVETLSDCHLEECYKDGYSVCEIECITFPTLFASYPTPNHINYISLDTEGSELKMLSKFPYEEYTVDLFSIEMSDPKIADLLISKGYREVKNPFNTWAPWEHYFAYKDFNLS